MFRITLIRAASIIAFLVPAMASGEEFRTEQLMWRCEADQNSLDGALDFLFCVGYLAGINDVSQVMPAYGGRLPYCPPKRGISNDQLIRIFLKWAHENPRELHKSARVSVLIALRKAFPCKR